MAATISKQYIDEDEIRKAIAILKPDGQLFEIRILGNGSTISGYFTDAETAIKELKRTNLYETNVYITLGAVNSACYSRAQSNVLRMITPKSKLVTTSDKDIDAYQWFFIDFDPERPTGVSSNNE